MKQRWWIAGIAAFGIGLGIGVTADRNSQRILGLGAIGLSSIAAGVALTSRAKVDRRPELVPAEPLPPLPMATERGVGAGTNTVSFVAWLPPQLRDRPLALLSALPPLRSAAQPALVDPALGPDLDEAETDLDRTLARKQQVEAVIAVLRKEKESLQAQINEGTERKQEMYTALAELEHQRQNLEDQFASRREALASITAQQAEIDRQTEAYNEVKTHLQSLAQERDRQQDQVDRLTTQANQLRQECARLAQEAQTSQFAVTAARQILGEAKQKQQQWEQERQHQDAHLRDLANQVTTYERQREALHRQLTDLEQKRSQLEPLVATLVARHRELSDRCRQGQQNLDELLDRLDQLRQQVTNLENQRSAYAAGGDRPVLASPQPVASPKPEATT